MDYRDILGFSKPSKKNKKISNKIKKPSITENLKKEFGPVNEWSETHSGPKRWSKDYNNDHRYDGLTEFEKTGGKDYLGEGPSYEYKKDIKNIDKSYKLHAKNILDFYEKLRKKGLDKEASNLLNSYKKNIVSFKKSYDKILRKLL